MWKDRVAFIKAAGLEKDYFMENVKRHKKTRYGLVYLGMVICLLLFVFLTIRYGTVDIPTKDMPQAILEPQSTYGKILWELRMPRLLAAILLGGALSVAGFCLQTFFSNPIAGPFILGISSGAKLVVALVMIYFLQFGMRITGLTMVASAFLGSMLAMGFVLLISKKTKSMASLIICGVMIGYICSAVTDFVLNFSNDASIVNLRNWSLGSFSGTTWEQVLVMFVIVAIAMVVAIFMAKPMGAFQLGEAYARNMGVNITVFKVVLILLSSILSACVTAFAGPISFVGVAVPHLTKKLFASSKPLLVIPGSFLLGGVFCLVCDLIAKLAFAPVEMNISSVTAIFGAPIVIWIMVSRRRGNE